MKLFRRTLIAALVLLCMAVWLLPAHAETVTQDGLEVELTAGQEAYQAGEAIEVTLRVKNIAFSALQNLQMEIQIPEGYAAKKATPAALQLDALPGGETATLAVTLTQEGEAAFPQTFLFIIIGVALIAVAAAVILVIVIKRKRSKQVVSTILCLALLLSVFAGLAAPAAAEELVDKTVETAVMVLVGDVPVEVKAVVHYQWNDRLMDDPDGTTYRVSFDSDGGTAFTTQEVLRGQPAVYPGIPEKDGYQFAGWFQSKDETDWLKQFDFSQVITRSMTLYAKWVDPSLDQDADRLPDALEPSIGTDPTKKDTDGDGLNDYDEYVVLGTDPTKKDTDGNGVSDYEEDLDRDGLSNGKEIEQGCNPVAKDTDMDGLLDGEEVNGTSYQTDPNLKDTDGDGASDLWELENDYDPLTYNDSFTAKAGAGSENVTVAVNAELPGVKTESLTVEAVVDHPIMNDQIPGYVDVPFEISVKNNLEGERATISFTLSNDYAKESGFVPAIYYYNEKTQGLEELPTTVRGRVASAEVDHFSKYILLNKTRFDEVWETKLRVPASDDEQVPENLDVVFVIDCSGSMDSYNRMVTAKTAMHTFMAALEDVDRAALVSFNGNAEILQSLTTDKAAVDGMVDSLRANGMTAMYTGLAKALDLLTLSHEEYGYKMVVVLSDGRDEPSTSYNHEYINLVARAKNHNIVVNTIGVGSSVSTSILKKVANETGGGYYHATITDAITDVFEKIHEETVDLLTDTDEDGIPDYYEQRLTTGGGIPLELDFENPDCDGDGLLDGEEIVIIETEDNKVYGLLKSDPWEENSDGDAYSDYEEAKVYGSDAFLKNIALDQTDTNYLTDDENFVSDKYMDFYESDILGALERGTIAVTNHIVASNHDTGYMYKTILMKYLETMVAEAEKANELQTVAKNIYEVLSQLKDQADDAVKKGIKENEELLKQLQDKMDLYKKKVDRLNEMDISKANLTAEQYYEIYDEAMGEYKKASDQIPELEKTIKFKTKLKKVSDAFGVVMDVVEIADSGYQVFKTYNSFSAKIAEMQTCLDTLYTIQSSPEAPKMLRDAAGELYREIENQKVNAVDAFFDGLYAVTGKALDVASPLLLAMIPVVGPYLAAAKEALGLIDFVFNLGDVAYECTLLYGISKSAHIVAKKFAADLSWMEKQDSRYIVYEPYDVVVDDYLALAVIRISAEEQMKTADEANAWFIEWLFTAFMYKVSEIDANVEKLNGMKSKYAMVSAY